MALDKEEVRKAHTILLSMVDHGNSFVVEWDENDRGLEELCDKIIASDRKYDEGWESIFIQIKNITADQLEIFNSRKKEVRNSSFIREMGNGITRLGWF